MTRWLVLAPLVVFYSLLNAASAESVAQTPISSTESLFERVNESVCTIMAVAGDGTLVSRGSGFVLRSSRLLVTNAHVLAGLAEAKAKCGGKYADIERITNYDQDVDLVLVETGELDVQGLELSTTSDIKPGSQVYAFGSPYGLEGTISPGLASGLREINGRSYIQISAPISSGSSGGPVTDDRGLVIAVTVASLDVAQSINFALPASAIKTLPEVDLRLSELLPSRHHRTQTFGRADSPTIPDLPTTADAATFRGHAFGSPCGDIAIAEYERRPTAVTSDGPVRFTKWYSGKLEVDVTLSGVPAIALFDCDERYGMVAGHYELSGHNETVAKISDVLRTKYGVGLSNPIAEAEASKMGCRWNYSLPGSRNYRPTERTTWNIDDRLRIDMIECGGASTSTFVFYSDPLLMQAVREAEDAARRAQQVAQQAEQQDLLENL